MNDTDRELLTYLAEECAEVIQAVTKCLRHGFDSGHPESSTNNIQDLLKEIGQVKLAISLLVDYAQLPCSTGLAIRLMDNAQNNKRKEINAYLHHVLIDPNVTVFTSRSDT